VKKVEKLDFLFTDELNYFYINGKKIVTVFFYYIYF